MSILIVGASGATGSKLVEQLLQLNQSLKIVVRDPEKLPAAWKSEKHLEIIHANILDLSQQELCKILADCNAVASCLGHIPTFKGMYGKPKKLCTDAVKNIYEAIKTNKAQSPVKFVLMSTTAYRNPDLNEPYPLKNKIVLSLLRLLVPPHVDNEKAADFLRLDIGQSNEYIEWVTVRPDQLINEAEVSAYEAHPSHLQNPIFNSGQTSRINVGHFMARLIVDDALWKTWKGQMPVIYNSTSE